MPPEDRTIACEKCGHPHVTRSNRTKYCKVCQVARDLSFMEGRPNIACDICEKDYAPVVRPKKGLQVCPTCKDNSNIWDSPTGHCAFCESDDVALVHDDVAVCFSCYGNPELRETVYKSIARKQYQRINTEPET